MLPPKYDRVEEVRLRFFAQKVAEMTLDAANQTLSLAHVLKVSPFKAT